MSLENSLILLNQLSGYYDVTIDTKYKLTLPTRYVVVQTIGSGAQGVVFSAFDLISLKYVVIKKLTNPFSDEFNAKRAYRELCLLSGIKHSMIIPMYSMFTPQQTPESLQDIYFIMEKMDGTIDKCYEKLLDHTRISFLTYQILCALKHLHASGVIHRDLKPHNIGLNNDCTVKLLDFGLSRYIENQMHFTKNIVTLFYRAPEVLLSLKYNEKIDVWSVGCIMAELIIGKIFFKAHDELSLWNNIVEKIGYPNDNFLNTLPSILKDYMKKNLKPRNVNFEEHFPDSFFDNTPPDNQPIPKDLNSYNCRDVLKKMLKIDPNERISVDEALNHPYLKIWKNEEEISNGQLEVYNPDIENTVFSIKEWKQLIFNNIKNYENTNNIFLKPHN
uniref:Stress-activated protein kinase JNK n=2 Tax=Strongyloides stercoralis TaxID=6248 RepID=A0A0K0EP83_STRER